MRWLLILLFASTAVGQTRDNSGMITRFQTWRTEKIDLENYRRVSGRGRRQRACTCSMCGVINGWKAAYRIEQRTKVSSFREKEVVRPTAEVIRESALGATTADRMDAGIRLADIGPQDIVAELGCGIAEWSVRAVEAGALRAYGFEIDYEMYQKAKEHVREAVLQGRISAGKIIILHKDVRDVDLSKYGTTIVLAFLYDTLLDELAASGTFTGIDRIVSPLHFIDLPEMTEGEHGDIYLYTSEPSGQPERRSHFKFDPISTEKAEGPQVKPEEPVVIEQLKSRKPKLALLFYHASWCGPCKTWIRTQKANVNIHVEDMSEAEASRHGIRRYPSFRLGLWNEQADKYYHLHQGSLKTPLIQWQGGVSASVINKKAAQVAASLGLQVKSQEMLKRLKGVNLPEVLLAAIEHPDTIWTDREKHPALQMTEHGTYLVGYNMAGRKDLSKSGSPNNEKPWRFSGGCDAFADLLDGETCFYVPGKVKVWRDTKVVPGFTAGQTSVTRWAGEYPVGTVGAEFLSANGTLHAVRYREKTAEGWYGEQVDVSPMPDGYVPVANCVDCHSDIGKHANEIDSTQEWYSHVRGFEKDGFFNSPFTLMTGRGEGKGHNDFMWDNPHLLEFLK
jgi:hypothetical protein